MTQKIDGYKVSQPLTLGVAGGKGVNHAAPGKAVTASDGAGAPTSDQVTLTQSAKSLQQIEQAVASAPVVNTNKVDAIKLAVNNGTYTVDSGRVADKILQFERAL